ncbi:MAG: YdjY domain-containing protein [Planctomycetota bacterium]
MHRLIGCLLSLSMCITFGCGVQSQESATVIGPVESQVTASDPTPEGSSDAVEDATSDEAFGDQPMSLTDPLTDAERAITADAYVNPEEIVREAFASPPDAIQLSMQRVWIDRANKRVYADGYVTMREGPLEMFACPIGTKEHESIVATLAKASDIHTGLLAIGAQQGTPVSYVPKFVPATGQRVRVWVTYRDKKGDYQAVDARRWIQRNGKPNDHMESDWVFAGGGFNKGPDGIEYYSADSGDMICVSNFSTAMLDIPVASSSAADDLLFIPFTERIPDVGTPVRLVFVPVPLKSDTPDPEPKVDPAKPPTEEVLPKN